MGIEILNSSKVTYPKEFELSQILPQKALAESNNTEIKYRLGALVEHVGRTPHSGHYVAYKRLFPESLESRHNSNSKAAQQNTTIKDEQHCDKWVEANDE